MKKLIIRIVTMMIFITCSLDIMAYEIKGKVIDKISREPLPFVNVTIYGKPGVGASTDINGVFTIENIQPGIYRLSTSYVGYKTVVTPEYMITIKNIYVEIELEEDAISLEGVTISPNTFRKLPDAPVSLRLISLQEIEKNPGANRDISKIVQSYPGVSFTPANYRNDLIVRGGSPSENKFYLDGIEIPNINHFSTQGASGGPTGIINADFIREVGFYTGSFPADKGNALSSILDFKLKDGNMNSNTYKLTVGAAELSLTGDGHIGDKVSYIASVRQSYLQLLFKMLQLPFLPKFTDGQFKIKSRIDSRNEIIFLGLFGIDDMKLNTSITGESAEYLLSYLPTIKQETFTLGAAYKHYGGKNIQSLSVSYSYLNNRNIKYRDNDESSEDNLTMRLKSIEQKASVRFENKTYLGNWTWSNGAEISYAIYDNNSYNRIFLTQPVTSIYNTDLGITMWGIHSLATYVSPDKKLSASVGFRSDGADYSAKTARMYRNISPRASISYSITPKVEVSGSTGIYYQLPPYTALGYKDNNGNYANKDLDYMRVIQGTIGSTYNINSQAYITAELFYKQYGNIPLSIADNIPLSCKGNDYGVVGNELLKSSAQGRSYGLELLGKWQIPEKLSLISSFTLYRSEYRNDKYSKYIVSAWDNQFILNVSGTYELPRRWSIGARLSCLGGAPYTPYDEDKSSLIQAWDVTGRPYLDYTRYNEERLPAFAQLDIRIDKVFFFPRTRLGLYLDLQNVTMSKVKQADIPFSTGQVNPEDDTRYIMKHISREYGSLVPTLGVSLEF